MKHEFTDEEILYAANKSLFHYGEYNSELGYSWSMTEESLRSFLDALPEPQDEWEACDFEDIQEGDTIRYETPDALIELKHPVFRNFGDELVFAGDMKVWIHPDATWYRISAPHPDPAEHPVILVTEYDVAGNIMECEPTPFFAHDGVYKNDIYAHRPDDVLSWSPAKVVADDDC